jgi:transposase
MYSLIVTAKLNDVDPQAWLADVLARIDELKNLLEMHRENSNPAK